MAAPYSLAWTGYVGTVAPDPAMLGVEHYVVGAVGANSFITMTYTGPEAWTLEAWTPNAWTSPLSTLAVTLGPAAWTSSDTGRVAWFNINDTITEVWASTATLVGGSIDDQETTPITYPTDGFDTPNVVQVSAGGGFLYLWVYDSPLNTSTVYCHDATDASLTWTATGMTFDRILGGIGSSAFVTQEGSTLQLRNSGGTVIDTATIAGPFWGYEDDHWVWVSNPSTALVLFSPTSERGLPYDIVWERVDVTSSTITSSTLGTVSTDWDWSGFPTPNITKEWVNRYRYGAWDGNIALFPAPLYFTAPGG
jgi:hypothetical protein